MNNKRFIFASLLHYSSVFGLMVIVSDPDIEGGNGLRAAITAINMADEPNNYIFIQMPAGSNLSGQTKNLQPIQLSNQNSLTIVGPPGGVTYQGSIAPPYRGFLISSGNVSVLNVNFVNAVAQGGAGGSGGVGGGGGMGAGGALFVQAGAVLTLNASSIISSQAIGGAGGNAYSQSSFLIIGGGGGGGMGGNGGVVPDGTTILAGGGGGGLFGNGGSPTIAPNSGHGSGAGGGGLFGNGGGGAGVGADLGATGGGGGGSFGNGADGNTTSVSDAGGDGGGDSLGNPGGTGGQPYFNITSMQNPPFGQNGTAFFNGGGGGGGGGGLSDIGQIARGGDGSINGGGGGGSSGSQQNSAAGNPRIIEGSNGGNGGTFGGGGAGGSRGGDTFSGHGGYGGGGGGGSGASEGSGVSDAYQRSGIAGNGGFGGGGGGSVAQGPSRVVTGGLGGFGGGGGGGQWFAAFSMPPPTGFALGGAGGVFGGNGGNGGSGLDTFGRWGGGGGGGAGLGGAIFIQTGGTVQIQDGVSFSSNSVTAGAGGSVTMTPPSTFGQPGFPGTALGDDIFMMSGSQLIFDIGGSFTLASNIESDSGQGGASIRSQGVIKTGFGTVTLNGTNNYTGLTNIFQGTLFVNGSINTDVIIVGPGILRGTGTINGAITVESGGVLAPGSSIGSLTSTGPLTLQPDSQMTIEANAAGMSSALIVNTADPTTTSLDGILFMEFDPGSYLVGQMFTILSTTNSTITGTFSEIQSNMPAFVLQAVYNANSVQVVIQSN